MSNATDLINVPGLTDALAAAREAYNALELEFRADDLEHPDRVGSKPDFAARYKAGEFGNASPTWDTVDALLKWGQETYPAASYPGPVPGRFHLRNRDARGGGGATHYDLTWSAAVARWLDEPDKALWYCSMMAPEADKVFQGELVCLPGELWLTYNLLPLPMREGMAKGMRHARNTAALVMLRHFLCGNSMDWLNVLLDRFSSGDQTRNHAVEFSTYSRPWGTPYPLGPDGERSGPKFNTVFWEVRCY